MTLIENLLTLYNRSSYHPFSTYPITNPRIPQSTMWIISRILEVIWTQEAIVSDKEEADCALNVEHGTLIFLSFVCSLLRNASFPSSKLKALDILLALAEHLPDDVKLDRLVPYLMTLLSDDAALVRANAIKTLTQVVIIVDFFFLPMMYSRFCNSFVWWNLSRPSMQGYFPNTFYPTYATLPRMKMFWCERPMPAVLLC